MPRSKRTRKFSSITGKFEDVLFGGAATDRPGLAGKVRYLLNFLAATYRAGSYQRLIADVLDDTESRLRPRCRFPMRAASAERDERVNHISAPFLATDLRPSTTFKGDTAGSKAAGRFG